MSYHADQHSIDLKAVKAEVENILGHRVYLSTSQDGSRFSYK